MDKAEERAGTTHTQLLVRQILEVSSRVPDAFEWSLQGMGMFRLYLSPEVRLHVWDSKFAVENVSTLHDHPWDFTSTVIYGSVEDRTYNMRLEGEPNYHKQQIVCGEGGCAVGTKEDVRLIAVRSERVIPGWCYFHKRTDIHESKPKNGTVTIIRRTFYDNTEVANVFFPAGTEWVSAEPRPATNEEIVDMALRTLDSIKEFEESGGASLQTILDALKGYEMSPEEQREQAVSFAVGNLLVDHPELKDQEQDLRNVARAAYDDRHKR